MGWILVVVCKMCIYIKHLNEICRNKDITEPISNWWIYNTLLTQRGKALQNLLSHLNHGGIYSLVKHVSHPSRVWKYLLQSMFRSLCHTGTTRMSSWKLKPITFTGPDKIVHLVQHWRFAIRPNVISLAANNTFRWPCDCIVTHFRFSSGTEAPTTFLQCDTHHRDSDQFFQFIANCICCFLFLPITQALLQPLKLRPSGKLSWSQ